MSETWNGHALEITEMTEEDFEAYIEERRKCQYCSECYCEADITLNGEEVNGGCAEKNAAVMRFLLDRAKYVEEQAKEFIREHEKPTAPVEQDFYSATRKMMLSRGYTKCYMCGSDLCKE